MFKTFLLTNKKMVKGGQPIVPLSSEQATLCGAVSFSPSLAGCTNVVAACIPGKVADWTVMEFSKVTATL